jgi:hypothetical protein
MMGEFIVTMPDGSKYKSYADDPEAAHTEVRQQWAKDSQEKAPPLSKARMFLEDPLNQIVHGMTAGLFDKGFDAATGADSATTTAAGADRMGPVATGIARAGGAMALPSAAPRAVAAVGGGPMVRGLIGAGTAAGEQAAYGGVDAATQGQDVPAGILSGAVGGAVGQGVAQAAGKVGDNALRWAKGIDDAAPARNITTLPKGKAPSVRDLVDVVEARAQLKPSAEATQAAQISGYKDLMTGKNKGTFTKTQLDRMRDVAVPDTGTDWSKNIGQFMNNKLFAGGLVAGGGASTASLATAAGILGGGKALTVDSAKGTQEAVDRLRQLVYKKTPFRGPLSDERVRALGQALGYGGMTGMEDYLGQ